MRWNLQSAEIERESEKSVTRYVLHAVNIYVIICLVYQRLYYFFYFKYLV